MSSAPSLLLRNVELPGRSAVDVRIDQGAVTAVGAIGEIAVDGVDEVIEGRGGALLPGLHDHHLHLRSLAAALSSVRCGPPEVNGMDALRVNLRTAPSRPEGWVRGIGYHESVAGPLDRWRLDQIVDDRPVRIQHRSGGLWILNSLAALRVGLDAADESGIERDDSGLATGRLWRLDRWLRARLPESSVEIAAAGASLVRHGITGVTDATPDLEPEAVTDLALATTDGRLPLAVLALGPGSEAEPSGRLMVGPWKILLPDHDLPPLDDLVSEMRVARGAGRAVAVHCVTRVALVLTLTALDVVGRRTGDRIEHGAVIPRELLGGLRDRGLAIVVQPGLVADRGDDYIADVAPDDVPDLHRHGSLLALGVRTVASSDAPFGDPDPWRTLVAARDRTTPLGSVVGATERVDPAVTLAGLLSPLDDPGGPPRQVEAGAAGDLCLLDRPLAAALAEPTTDAVRLTVSGGEIVHERR